MSIIVYKQRFAPPTDRFTPIKNYLHVGYIATRPRSMKNEDGIHGLFGYLFPGNPCSALPWQDTARHVRQQSKENKNIFRAIISFQRKDANDLGLITQADWRDYAEQHIRLLAEKNKISIANLGWCGAYHNEGAHPHLHIVFWDRSQSVMKMFVSPEVPNNIRIALIKETFADRLREYYEKKELSKDEISDAYGGAVADVDRYLKEMRPKQFTAAKIAFGQQDADYLDVAQLFPSKENLVEVAETLFALRDKIPKEGRVAYKSMPKEVKDEVDRFAVRLIQGNRFLQEAVEKYVDSMIDIKRLYSSLDNQTEMEKHRDKCREEAETQIRQKIIGSVRTIIHKERDVGKAIYKEAQKGYAAQEFMFALLNFFGRATVAHTSEWQEKQGGLFRDLSERAIREWYQKNKDKGLEF